MADLVVVGAERLVTRWGDPPRRDAWVACSDGRVEAIGAGPPPGARRILDARGGLVMPGFVNAHHHLFQGASRGIVVAGGLLDWLALHYAAWARMHEADVEAAATASLALLALGGCTTVAAFEYLHPPGTDMAAAVMRAADRVGLRLLYVRGCSPRLEGRLADELASRDVDVGRLVEPEEQALAATAALLRRPPDARLRLSCGPTTPVLDDDGAFQRSLNEIADEAGAGVHTHFHPLDGTRRHGETASRAARRLGLVRRGNWFAHGSRLELDDVADLGAAGVGLVHAPSCSVLLDYPIPPLAHWRAANERVAIAVDGAASNDRSSSLLEAQLAWQLQRALHAATGGAAGGTDVLGLMTEGAAHTIGWHDLGRLEVGGPADLAVLDLRGLELAGAPWLADEDPAGRLLRTYAGGRVRHLLVGERVVVDEGVLAGVDEAGVAANATATARRLYDQLA